MLAPAFSRILPVDVYSLYFLQRQLFKVSQAPLQGAPGAALCAQDWSQGGEHPERPKLHFLGSSMCWEEDGNVPQRLVTEAWKLCGDSSPSAVCMSP